MRLEREQPERRMAELLAHEVAATNLVTRPQLAELGEGAQPLEDPLERRIARRFLGGATQTGDEVPCLVRPVDEHRAKARISERDQERVAVRRRAPAVAKQSLGAAIP